MHQCPIIQQQDIAVMSILDLQEVCDQAICNQTVQVVGERLLVIVAEVGSEELGKIV